MARHPRLHLRTLDSPVRPGSVGSVALVVVGLLAVTLLTTWAPNQSGTFSGEHQGGAMQMSMQMTFTVRRCRQSRPANECPHNFAYSSGCRLQS